MSAYLCAHAELWSAIAGAIGALLLAIPYFVEWGHRRKREERLKRQRRKARAGGDAAIDSVIIEGRTEAVLASGSKRFLGAAVGALLLVLSFFLLIYFSLACGH